MKGEFKRIVMATLQRESSKQPNLASEACCDALAEKIEEDIKAKFHIFRINRLLTDDGGHIPPIKKNQ
jgi:hypothetical protein|tara:strand:+ start:78 stop:281 length:204 start_codon:yes stop_codon:yes gene_type:complete